MATTNIGEKPVHTAPGLDAGSGIAHHGDMHDPEAGVRYSGDRRGSKFDKKRLDEGADGEADDGPTVGDQIEMEKENAIKYRTCSWQKVTSSPERISFCSALLINAFISSC